MTNLQICSFRGVILSEYLIGRHNTYQGYKTLLLCRYSDFYLIIYLQFRFPNVSCLPFDCQSVKSNVLAVRQQMLFNKKTTTVLLLPFLLHLQRMIYLFITQSHYPVNESLTKLWLWEIVIHLWDFSSNLSLTNACEQFIVRVISCSLLE